MSRKYHRPSQRKEPSRTYPKGGRVLGYGAAACAIDLAQALEAAKTVREESASGCKPARFGKLALGFFPSFTLAAGRFSSALCFGWALFSAGRA